MKVLILANHVNYGGIAAYIFNLAKALRAREDTQVIVGSRGGDLEKDFKALGVEHIRLPLTTKCEVSPKVFLSAMRLRGFVKEKKVDIIHANTRVTQVLAALVCLGTGVPYVSTCHGYFKTRLGRRLMPCWGSRVIAISDQVRDHLVYDFYVDQERVELIYNGVDLENFRSYGPHEIEARKKTMGLAAGKKTVGHIGRLSSVKGQKFLVLAAEELVRRRNDVQFLIIGDGEEEKDLKKMIGERSLEGVVHIVPSVADTSLALALMDVFVMPSLQEGLGISILEAQAQGVPVVASRVGGIPTVIEDRVTGLLCAPQDAAGLASSIARLLDDQALRGTIVQNAKKHVAGKFSAALMAEKTLALYRSQI